MRLLHIWRNFLPNNYTPNNYTPNSYTPNSYTPNNYTPNNYTHNSYTPNSYTLPTQGTKERKVSRRWSILQFMEIVREVRLVSVTDDHLYGKLFQDDTSLIPSIETDGFALGKENV